MITAHVNGELRTWDPAAMPKITRRQEALLWQYSFGFFSRGELCAVVARGGG